MWSDDSRLSDLDRRILDFEQDRVARAGASEDVLWERFRLTSAGYHERLNRLVDLPGAEQHAPRLVRRLRRLRTARQTQRQTQRQEQRQASRGEDADAAQPSRDSSGASQPSPVSHISNP